MWQVVLLTFAVSVVYGVCTPDPVILKDGSSIQGFYDQDSLTFLGVPYAEPPVGNLRFADPKPKNWSTLSMPVQATVNKPFCMNGSPTTPTLNSEDCLYVNIFAPKNPASSQLPVMFWLHGGAYNIGGIRDYVGTNLAPNEQVIVVTVAYRFQLFGFYANPSLKSGKNMGLKDQILALQWVQNNIASFGGNPRRITIFGESVGGSAAIWHTIMTPSKTIPAAVISQSTYGFLSPTFEQSTYVHNNWAATVGCNASTAPANTYPGTASEKVLACLRALPAQQIVLPRTAAKELAYATPQVDKSLIKYQLLEALKNGHFNTSIPIIQGHNTAEGNFFTFLRTSSLNVTQQQYSIFTSTSVGPYFNASQEATIQSFYQDIPVDDGYFNRLAALLADFYVNCGDFLAAKYIDAKSKVNNFAYIFSYVSPNYRPKFPGSSHGMETPYEFGSARSLLGFLGLYDLYNFTQDDITFTQRFQRSWSSVAYTGSPNTRDSFWEPYNAAANDAFHWTQYSNSETLKFTSPVCENNADFWESVFLNPPQEESVPPF